VSTLPTDEQFLKQALDLAAEGIGLASPNPHVGAIIVDQQGAIVGRGFHTYAGVKHAEVLAIEQAGPRARGATLYINLEPCSHQGRTGPCADAVIAAGIRRVVVSMPDPNPKVSGQGFSKLRDAGISVDVGLLEKPARRLNEAFARYIRGRVPLVTLKSAMSLDGQIAADRPQSSLPSSTASRTTDDWITGEAARAHVQVLRHQNDAILTGIGTILADDPLLTDRSGRPRRRPLLRVVLDSELRLPLDSRLAKSASQGDHDVLVFCATADPSRRTRLEQQGIQVEEVARGSPGGVDLAAVFRRLGELEITSVMCEGGTRINSALLQAGLADKLFLYYAPKFLHRTESVPFADVVSPLKLSDVSLHDFGDDFAVEGYLRNPYAE
jgi:diaminohydroxyphosphoribosylaminopyrimidine deaminase / 5-amino-6-(5-phosphoribosylamino)uracil reductase